MVDVRDIVAYLHHAEKRRRLNIGGNLFLDFILRIGFGCIRLLVGCGYSRKYISGSIGLSRYCANFQPRSYEDASNARLRVLQSRIFKVLITDEQVWQLFW
jgi:hypothetical protein